MSSNITATIKSSANRNEVINLSQSAFIIHTTAPAHEGKANKAIIKLLAKHLNIPPSHIEITHGLKSKQKTIHLL